MPVQVDTARYPVAEVLVVVDAHQGPFIRQLSTLPTAMPVADMLSELLEELERLQSLGWIDKVVVADIVGCQAVRVRGRHWDTYGPQT